MVFTTMTFEALLAGGAVAALVGLACLKHVRDTRARISGSEGKLVFVTGCDSGFGFSLALRLSGLGFTVVAGCLTAAGAEKLKAEAAAESKQRLHALRCDVTKEQDLRAAAAHCEKLSGERGVFAVVANAGLGGGCPAELLDLDATAKLVDVNLMGVVRTNVIFLPLVRRACGRFINIGSIYSVSKTPLASAYVASKHGVVGWSDSFRMEAAQSGVDVVTIMPGWAVTPMVLGAMDTMKSMNMSAQQEESRRFYGEGWIEQVAKKQALLGKYFFEAPAPVVDTMVEAVMARYPCRTYKPLRNAKVVDSSNWMIPGARDAMLTALFLPEPAGGAAIRRRKEQLL